MRVLHLTLSAARGGRRDAILTLIDHLRPLGAECGLVALRNPSSEIAEIADRADYVGEMSITRRPTLSELNEVLKLCRARRVDVVHAHDHGSQYVASALRLVAPSLHAVMTFHRTLGIETEGMRNRTRNAVSLPLISRVLTASEERRRYFLQNTVYPRKRVRVIPLGVDLSRFEPHPPSREAIRAELGLSPETLVILAIGHFGPEKGIDRVLESLAAASPQWTGRPWHVAVLGSGEPGRIALMQQLADQLLPGKVSLVGFQANVARWMQGADILVHAPRQEAFGLVVVQAMACGLPVVAFAVGGVPELVRHGETGLLVQAGELAQLGEAAGRLLHDDRERQQLGERALGRAMQYYDARECARQHIGLYRQLAGSRTK